MSQLSRPAPPKAFIKLEWPDFVQCVLKLTVAAYQVMCEARVVQQSWEENVFTLWLGNCYIRQLLQQYESPIRVQVRPKIHTQQMYNGDQVTIQAKEADMLLFDIGEWEDHRVHFIWEAKLVGDKRVNYDKYSPLNSKYVNEAIYRFIRREYADNVSDAGVLGYVLAGSVDNIVNDINASMGNIRKNPALLKPDHLQQVAPIRDFTDVYHSRHERTDDTHIKLYHLLLTFDFE